MFIFIWGLIVPGTLLTHASIAKIIPPISDLPANLIKGFDVVFRFSFMEKDAMSIKTESETVLSKCEVAAPATICLDNSLYPLQTTPAQQKDVDTTNEKTAIMGFFDNSLGVVKKIANDKYLGTEDLANTATQLNNMTSQIAKVDSTMKCYMAVPVFCGLWMSGDALVNGMDQVNKAIDGFKSSDIVTQWNERKSILTFMHALPWLLIIGMLFFTLFWCKGGVCCCCRGGTKTGFGLIFFALFWLLSFVIYLVVCAIGLGIKYMADRLEVPILKGKPSLADTIDHIQVTYPAFWDTVFADLEAGLDLLLNSSFFFIGAALLILIYSLTLCCCCPYRKKGDD